MWSNGWVRFLGGGLIGAVAVTLAGQATAALGSACVICDPLLAAPTGAVLGSLAFWRVAADD